MVTNSKTIKKRKTQRSLRSPRVLVLTVLSGEHIGKEFVLNKKKILIGRDESVDIMVFDPLVSRRHAELSVRSGSKRRGMPPVILTDLNSTNGTYLNYQPITRAALKDGDKILLGQTILKLEYKDLCEQQFLDHLRKLSCTDGLTGLHNKTSIIRKGKEEFARARRSRRPFSCMMIDIDLFKVLNDTYGHVMGDVVLKEVGEVILSSVREPDGTGRFGGEEFLVLLPETRLPDAVHIAERLHEKIRALVFDHNRASFQVTVSIGICSNQESAPASFESMLDLADQALYLAKDNGRNCSATAAPDPPVARAL